MTGIVELREIGNQKIEELLENAREELFNLRFQRSSGQLEKYDRFREVKREIARYQTVINMRGLAAIAASTHPAVAKKLSGQDWETTAHYEYQSGAWMVVFTNQAGEKLATAEVDLNKKQHTVVQYEIVG